MVRFFKKPLPTTQIPIDARLERFCHIRQFYSICRNIRARKERPGKTHLAGMGIKAELDMRSAARRLLTGSRPRWPPARRHIRRPEPGARRGGRQRLREAGRAQEREGADHRRFHDHPDNHRERHRPVRGAGGEGARARGRRHPGRRVAVDTSLCRPD